jgi:indolepyruvate ferredoxin oxidoreductase beta subunit
MNGNFNMYMAGVGGQGIGLLSELLARAADYAGLEVRGCDTHGLAQRGGMVSSHLRLGPVNSPLIAQGQAQLVIALERTEALRAAQTMLAEGGNLVWYDTSWQALDVRSGTNPPVLVADVQAAAKMRAATTYMVCRPDLADVRMQNMAVIAELLHRQLLPGIGRQHVESAMRDLMSAGILDANLALLSVS